MITIYCDTGDHVSLDMPGLSFACLDGLSLHRARLDDSVLIGASLVKTDLRGASLGRTIFDDSDLRGASLIAVWAVGASFRGANLANASFDSANCKGANMDGAICDYVEFWNTDLREASFRGSRLSHCLHLNTANLQNARYTDSTEWPSDFDPQRAGAIKVDF